jgi:hypothetical protein
MFFMPCLKAFQTFFKLIGDKLRMFPFPLRWDFDSSLGNAAKKLPQTAVEMFQTIFKWPDLKTLRMPSYELAFAKEAQPCVDLLLLNPSTIELAAQSIWPTGRHTGWHSHTMMLRRCQLAPLIVSASVRGRASMTMPKPIIS